MEMVAHKVAKLSKKLQNLYKYGKKLRLSGYFIQLLRYTAAVDGDIDT